MPHRTFILFVRGFGKQRELDQFNSFSFDRVKIAVSDFFI